VGNIQLINGRIKATKTKQQAIQTAIVNFVARNNRLPCPAIATTTEGSVNYGVEAANPGVCTGVTRFGAGANRNVKGIVPWIALGLSDVAVLDGYLRRFTYQVLRSETNRDSATISGLTGNIQLRDAASGNTVNPNNFAVAVIVSHGENGYGAYLPSTGRRVSLNGAGVDERENTDNDVIYVKKTYSDILANPFDDQVLALTPSEIKTELNAMGVLATTTVVAEQNKRFEKTTNALLAAVIQNNQQSLPRLLPYADRSGGCGQCNDGVNDNRNSGNVPWVDIGLPEDMVVDPAVWTAQMRRSYFLYEPSTSDISFTLTAYGSDGRSGGGDDTVLSVSEAEIRLSLAKAGITLP